MAQFKEVYIGLLHYPVYNKHQECVASAVTTTDIHDLARLAQTYSLGGAFMITPLRQQQLHIGRILRHWFVLEGAEYNPYRRTALSTVFVANDFKAAAGRIAKRHRMEPSSVLTSARRIESDRAIGFVDLAKKIKSGGRPIFILLGTGWGIVDDFQNNVDYILEPIAGAGEFNHLSVRAAAAILVDRLVGR